MSDTKKKKPITDFAPILATPILVVYDPRFSVHGERPLPRVLPRLDGKTHAARAPNMFERTSGMQRPSRKSHRGRPSIN